MVGGTFEGLDIRARLYCKFPVIGPHRAAHSQPAGHVLLVNYFFPPATGGGVPRPVKMAKYLCRLGWTVTVLTVRVSGRVDERLDVSASVPIVRVPEWRLGPLLEVLGAAVRLLRRGCEVVTRRRSVAPTLLDRGFVYEEKEIEASKIGWVVPAVAAARRLHSRTPIDIAVVSVPPPSSGTVGWLLHRTCGVPYVVEYRDPWTVGAFWTADADGRPRTDPVTKARLRLTSRLEAALLQWSAGAIVVNGEAHVRRLREKFPAQTTGKPVAQIRNGVDLEDAQSTSGDATGPAIRLLHAGFFYHFYTPHHLVTALFRVQDEYPQALVGVEVDFMGDGFPEQLLREARARGLADVIRRTPAGSYSDALAAMHTADGLVAVVPPLESDKDRLPTKLYEYLATDRPILAVAPLDGAIARLLWGVPDAQVADSGDQEAIAMALVELIARAHRRRTDGASPGNRHRADSHHYRARAMEMDAFLRRVLAAPVAPPRSRSFHR